MYPLHTFSLVSSSQITSDTVHVITVLLTAPASTRPCSYLVFHRRSTSSELFSSASADSYHLWCYSLAVPHWRQVRCISCIFSLMSEIKTLRSTVCSKMDSLCYLQVCLRCSHNPSDAVQAWDSVAGLPLVVISFCASMCVCVTYRKKQIPQITGTSVLLRFKSWLTTEIQVYVFHFWANAKCHFVCVTKWIWLALKRLPHWLMTSKLIYSKHF